MFTALMMISFDLFDSKATHAVAPLYPQRPIKLSALHLNIVLWLLE